MSASYLRNIETSLSKYYGIEDPPVVKVVRVVLPEEVDEAVRACVEGEGFPISSDGGVKIPEGQDSVYKLAQYTCRLRYPIVERYAQPLKAKQLGAQYNWTIDFVVPCLERKGFAIENVPTKARFIDTWNSEPFFPFEQVELDQTDASLYNQAMSDLESSCPQTAPSPVLWDGLSVRSWIESHGDI